MAYRTYGLGLVVERRLVGIENFASSMVAVEEVVDDVDCVRIETVVDVFLK